MIADIESVRARRYLLGDTNDEETAVIEQKYFEDDEAVDRIAAAEDDLIEDYLAGQLTPADRDRFERGYLSVPAHRIRVETIRRLMTTATPRGSAQGGGGLAPKRTIRYIPWLALAASLLIVASAAFWMLSPFGRPQASSAANRTAPATPSSIAPPEQTPRTAPNAPRIFAVTISPVAVRSAAESARVVVPAGTDVVALRLESEGGGQLVARRVSIRTVAGTEVWQGSVVTDGERTSGVAGRVDVPAASLPADDYMVTLYGVDRAGVEREWTQYFLRLRAQ